MGTLSVEKQEKLQKDAEKLERKGEKKAEAEMKRKEVGLVLLFLSLQLSLSCWPLFALSCFFVPFCSFSPSPFLSIALDKDDRLMIFLFLTLSNSGSKGNHQST